MLVLTGDKGRYVKSTLENLFSLTLHFATISSG